jgi:hypothetical protein
VSVTSSIGANTINGLCNSSKKLILKYSARLVAAV